MILELFVLFLILSGFLMVFGYYSKIRAFSIVGLSIVFILASWIILYSYSGKNITGLEYKSGTTINEVNSTHTITTYNYSTYNDSTTLWVGYLLAIVSAIGIFLVAVNDR